MNKHLSKEQFETCQLGGAGQQELEHLSECAECRAELEHLAKLLSLFRSAIRHRVDDQIAAQVSEVIPSFPPSAIPRWCWALVATGFFAVVVSPFFISEIKPPQQSEPETAK